MNVLVSIRQPVIAWEIPSGHVERLRREFPHITFTHALDEAADLAGIEDADIAFTWTMSPDMLERGRRLRWVHTSAVAVGTFPLAGFAARGLLLTNSRGIQSPAIAEHVMACLLAFARGLLFSRERQAQRTWAQNEMIGALMPWTLQGRTMGIVGLGSIGQAVAVRAAAFGMCVIGTRRRPHLPDPPGVGEVLGPDRLDDVLERSDVVVLAAPLTGDTERVLGAREIARLKPGVVVINVARGQLIDEEAFVAALRSGHVGAAALDVFPAEPLPESSPFWSLPNVLITPHTAGFRSDHWDAVIDLFAENLRRFERGEPLLNLADPAAGY